MNFCDRNIEVNGETQGDLTFLLSVMLTDEEVAELSPAAAAASALIKGGISLTGIYREHCKVVEELEEKKSEYAQLQKYFEELIQVDLFTFFKIKIF